MIRPSLPGARRRQRTSRALDVHARYRRPVPRAAVPSFFTLMNLFCGFMAITQIHEGQYVYGCYLIALAGFFDLIDGFVARLSQGQSQFGVELDSLCDVVSFGVAPAYLIYAFALSAHGVVGVMVSALPAMCAAVRLARYNLAYDAEPRDYFRGLPAPVHAFVMISLVLSATHDTWLYQHIAGDTSALLPALLVLSALMVTNIGFEGTPKPTSAYLAAKPWVATGYAIGLGLVIVFRESGLLLGLVAYILTGILRAVFRATRRRADS